MKKYFCTIIILLISLSTYSQQITSVYIYNYTHKKGKKYQKESGYVKFEIYNALNVTFTNGKKYYPIPKINDNIIFTNKPSGYINQARLNEVDNRNVL